MADIDCTNWPGSHVPRALKIHPKNPGKPLFSAAGPVERSKTRLGTLLFYVPNHVPSHHEQTPESPYFLRLARWNVPSLGQNVPSPLERWPRPLRGRAYVPRARSKACSSLRSPARGRRSEPMIDPTTIIRDPNDEAFHSGLQCCVLLVAYDFRTRVGRLDMARGNCCDMSGAIAFFEAIDPQVIQIQTYAAAKRDTVYVKRRWGWQSIGADGLAWPMPPIRQPEPKLQSEAAS